jgi:restriction system protein
LDRARGSDYPARHGSRVHRVNAVLIWVVSLIVMLALGGAAAFYILGVLRRRDETAAGITALSAMSWREFIHLVLEVLARRGYSRLVDRDTPSSDGEYTLVRNRERWLLSCKHGSAFVLGNAAINELAGDINVQGAAGGFLVTQGRIGDEARGPARLQRIELLDGPTLWPEIRDLIPPAQLDTIHAEAGQRARQRILFAWLIALLTGIAVFVSLPRAPDTPEADAAAAKQPPAVPATPALGKTPAQPGAEAPQAMPDAAELERQRKDVANAISTLPMVDRAVWTTQSTLEVFLLETDSDAIPSICPLVERYPALASSRIMLTPPQGSQVPVRFRQCRSY